MRAPHHFHGILDLTPFQCLFDFTFFFAGDSEAGGLDNGLRTVLLEHLSRDGVDFHPGDHDPLREAGKLEKPATGIWIGPRSLILAA